MTKSTLPKVTKVIIPVAGFGTRFLPVTKAMPKEMLPIVDKPIIQYIVEEVVAAGMTDVIFITGRGKRAIEDHFDASFELEQTLVERDKQSLLKLVKPLERMARFTYVRQNEPLGNGDAILRAKHLIGEGEPFAVVFGDDIVDSKVPALTQLMRVFDRYRDPVMAMYGVPRAELALYGTIDGTEISPGVWEANRIVEKPKDVRSFKKSIATIGKYILPYEGLAALEEEARAVRAGKRGKNAEVGLTDMLGNIWVKRRPVYGVEIKGDRYDCGNKLGYLEANIAYALKRPELRRDLRKFM